MDKVSLTLTYPNDDKVVAEAMVDLCERVNKTLPGVTLEAKGVAPHALRDEVEVSQSYDLAYWHYDFPDESFWWSGEASFDAGPIRARLVLGAEAAFDTPTVQDGHQIAFGRIRARLDGAVPGATYEIIEPYGVIRTTADDGGRLFYTDDNGCMSGPCGSFSQLLTQPVGPVLRWDSGAPAGYVGDPNVTHTVTGSPYDTNEFTVTQVTESERSPASAMLKPIAWPSLHTPTARRTPSASR